MNYVGAVWMVAMGLAIAGCGDDASSTGGGESSGSSTGMSTTDPGTTTGQSGSTSTDPSTTVMGSSTSEGSGSTSLVDSSSSGEAGSGSSSGEGSSSGSTGEVVLPECDYPISWPADPGAQAAAQTVLDTLSAEATMNWHDDRGTFSSIFGMDVVIDCEDGESLLDAVFAFFAEYPDLFPMDGSEWFTSTGTQCQHVTSPTGTTYNTSRRDFGDWLVARDSVAVRLRRDEDGNVRMTSVVATFLPILPEEIETQIANCIANGDPELITEAARDESYAYQIYGGATICQPTGVGAYDPEAADGVSPTEGARVGWFEAGDDSTTITVAQRLEVVVDESNVTQELLASSAACPDQNGPGTVVGWAVFIDVVTAEVISSIAGLGCIVC